MKSQFLINHLMDDQHFNYITKLKKTKIFFLLECFYFHFSKTKFDLVVALCMITSFATLQNWKRKKKTKTHTHTFTSFAFSKWHNTWPHLWEHGIPQHQSINQSINQSKAHTPILLILKPKKNGWNFHINGWNLTYTKRGEEGGYWSSQSKPILS